MQALPALLRGSVLFEPEDLKPAGSHERDDRWTRWAHMGQFNASQSKLLCKQLSERLLQGVAGAQAVLLLQTSSVYTDAVRAMPRTQTAALCSWAILARQLTLLELYWAVRQEKPIICLRIQDSDYDFGKVTRPFPMPKGKAAPGAWCPGL